MRSLLECGGGGRYFVSVPAFITAALTLFCCLDAFFFAAFIPTALPPFPIVREDDVSTPTSSSRTVLPSFRPFRCREDNVSTPTSSSRTVSSSFRPFSCREDDVSTLTSSSGTVSSSFRPFSCREDDVSTPTSSSSTARSRRSAPRKSVRNGQCLPMGTPPPAASYPYPSATGFWALFRSCREWFIVPFVRFPFATGFREPFQSFHSTRSRRSAPRKSVRKGQCLPMGTPPPAAPCPYPSATGFWALFRSCREWFIVPFVRFPSATGF